MRSTQCEKYGREESDVEARHALPLILQTIKTKRVCGGVRDCVGAVHDGRWGSSVTPNASVQVGRPLQFEPGRVRGPTEYNICFGCGEGQCRTADEQQLRCIQIARMRAGGHFC